MKDITCPYCDTEQDIDHDDGYGYAEDETFEQECIECEKTFVFTTSISFHYSASKADCLNGEPHKYEPTHTYPKQFTRMRCIDCDNERTPTEIEMQEILNV